ncbi:MAG: hypothetical protein K6E98_00655, partial [Lachnospiraceae bacterium]|nr:hypothetical protein [Lachnospiraceae bacterium]
MISILYALFFSVIYVFLCHFFATCFVETRRRDNITKYVYYTIWTILILFISIVAAKHLYIKMVLIPICSSVFIFLLQKLSAIQAVLVSLIYYGIGCAIECTVYIFYSNINSKYILYIEENSATNGLLGVISQIILFIIIS